VRGPKSLETDPALIRLQIPADEPFSPLRRRTLQSNRIIRAVNAEIMARRFRLGVAREAS